MSQSHMYDIPPTEEELEAIRMNINIINFQPLVPLKYLKSNYVGKFIAVRGTVVRVSIVKPMVKSMVFECIKCGYRDRTNVPDGKYIPPEFCRNPGGCGGKNFLPDRSSAITVDWQKLRIQELASEEQREEGRMPRTLEAEITGSLIDTCIPGDIIIASGVMKVVHSEADGAGRGRAGRSQLFLLYMDVNSIVNERTGNKEKSGMEAEETVVIGRDDVQFSERELRAVREIHKVGRDGPDALFRLLVNSLAPGIFGHELVKAGMLLALLGGVTKYENDATKLTIRGDPHVLVVGDPGLGKSQLLTAAAAVAPRGVYVCGNTTSTSGLTVTVVRDSITGDFTLEAGALVLADTGCCCIDEFDKMGGEQQALLEAMEQQSVSVAKAGIVCNLSARTSVIAAANPVGGHYNRAKTVAENLKLGAPVLSRFDLIFILLDKPDETRDQLLSEHIMALHAGKRQNASVENIRSRSVAEERSASQVFAGEDREPLYKRLQIPHSMSFEPLPASLLKTYISYARQYCKPEMSEGAKRMLQDFYIELRRRHHSAEATPITTRQLESLIRLSEARAKADLREIITEEDAQDVVEIMKESLYDVCADETGALDFSRASGGMSKSKEAQRYVTHICNLAQKKEDNIFSYNELYEAATEIALRVNDFDLFVETLNANNYLLKKPGRRYQLVTTSHGLSQSQRSQRRNGYVS